MIGVRPCMSTVIVILTRASRERERERGREGGRRFYRERPRIFARGIEFAGGRCLFSFGCSSPRGTLYSSRWGREDGKGGGRKRGKKKGGKERRREGNGPAFRKTQLPLPLCDSSARPRPCKSSGRV